MTPVVSVDSAKRSISTQTPYPDELRTMDAIGMVPFYATFAALGGFWLYFFNKESVKTQFQGGRPSGESAAPHMPLGTLSATQDIRPLSISIIGWFLLICSGAAPFGPSSV